MAGNSNEFHEDAEQLSSATKERHRAIASLMEELEAVDWYDQRVDATDDTELRELLAHNRDEEKEHAAMMLEWLRRNDSKLDEELRTYLFKEGPITALEESATGSGDSSESASPNDGSLGIGSLKGA